MPARTSSDTAFRLGWAAGRSGQPKKACPYEAGTADAISWGEAWRMAVKVGRGKQNASPWCQQPTDCRARADGLCRVCVMDKNHADPEFREKRDANIRKAHVNVEHNWNQSPERRAAASAKLKERWKDPDFRKSRAAGVKKAFADPGKRAAILAAMDRARQTPEFKERARRQMATLHTPAMQAKAKASRVAKGLEMPRSRQRKIAHEVRDTEDTYEAIGRRYDITGGHVRTLAKKFGTVRPPSKYARKPKPPA